MARYTMNLADGVSVTSGVTRDDDAEALREASIAACDILRDELREGRCPATVTVTVIAADMRQVGVVRVSGSFE